MLDAFLRSVAYCLHPRVIALSVLPLLLIGAMMLGFSHFYWDDAVGAVRTWLESIAALERLWDWLRARGMAGAEMHVAPLIVVRIRPATPSTPNEQLQAPSCPRKPSCTP